MASKGHRKQKASGRNALWRQPAALFPPPEVFYHYTNNAGLEGILASKKITMSGLEESQFRGVFLTRCSPYYLNREIIALNNYGERAWKNNLEMVEMFIELWIPRQFVMEDNSQPGRNICLLPKEIDLNKIYDCDWKYGRVES